MKCAFLIVLGLSTLGTVVPGAENAADLEAKGIAALKRAQAEDDLIIQSALQFGKAAALYEKAGKAAKLSEMNAFLFWCKKKFSAEQLENFQKGTDAATPDIFKRMEKLENDAPPASDAKTYYDRAMAYAGAHPAEHLLIAVMFFEVVERFGGTDFATQAQERRYKEMKIVSGNDAGEAKGTGAKFPKPKGGALSAEEKNAQAEFKKAYKSTDKEARKTAAALLTGAYHTSSWQLLIMVATTDPDAAVRAHAFEIVSAAPARNSSLARMQVQCYASVKPADTELRLSFAKAMASSEFKFEIAELLANQLAAMQHPEMPGGQTGAAAASDKARDEIMKARTTFEGLLTAFNGLTGCDVWVATPGAPKRVKDWWTANQKRFAQADKELTEKYKKEDAEAK